MIIVGPGSLYTSVLPNLLVEGIRRAIEMAKGMKVYVCNVATEQGETDSFAVSDHYQVLYEHVQHSLFHYVVANNNIAQNGIPADWHVEPVRIDKDQVNGTTLIAADVVSEDNRYHHDTEKLSQALISLYYQRRPVEQLPPRLQPESKPQEATVY
jgi:uncharacterized cofD-like protein